MQKKLTLLFILLAFTLILPLLANAQAESINMLKEAGKSAYGEAATPMESETFIGTMAGKVISAFLGLLGIILLILILYGGFLWMTAGGNEEKIGKAKKILANAVIGLIIVIMAYGISYFVVTQLQKAATTP